MGCEFYKITPRRVSYTKNKKDLEKLFDEQSFDILHFHVNTLSYIEPVLLALKKNVKVIVHSRNAGAAGSQLTQALHKINKFRLQLLADKITKVSVSQLAGEWLFGRKSDFKVYNNGINLNKFRFLSKEREKVRHELNIDEATFLLGNVGAFVPAKNQEFAVKVLKAIIDTGVDAKLILIGDGKLIDRVKDLVVNIGLTDKVIFLGQRKDMPNLFSALDLFLFPSFYEGFPNAVLEAQACGLPCLISNKITREVVIDNNSVKQLSINNVCHDEWLQESLNFLNNSFLKNDVNFKRKTAWQKLKNAGFSDVEEVKKIESLYIEISGRNY
tara:strand:+ start:1990 stop:2973 length:984 start_codon:yes stop_codon:yes gene_type:complete